MMKSILFGLFMLFAIPLFASRILVPMDDSQANHLKAYGVTFWVLGNGVEADWLLNYRGGSFMFKNVAAIENECIIRGVSYQIIADVQAAQILDEISDPEVNMEMVKLEVAPRVAVYSPAGKLPWDDAVTLVLTYAEIPYDIVYDEEVLTGVLPKYIGCIFITKILQVNLVSFTKHIERQRGIKMKSLPKMLLRR